MIALTTIIKNEESCVLNMLKSVEGKVQAYYIVDTGSTDGTIDIVREFLKDKKGKLVEKKWQGFAVNRNQAVNLCEEEYCIQLDADEIFEGELKIEEEKDLYGVYITGDRYEYFMSGRIFKKHLRYQGIIHEHPANPKSMGVLEGCSIFHTEKGQRSVQGKTGDMKMLSPKMEGYAFYMGELYRQQGEVEKAIEYYRKAKGMYVGVCTFRIAELTKDLTQWVWYMYGFNGTRMLEHLYFAVKLLREINHVELAYKFAKAREKRHYNIFYIPDIHNYLFDVELYHLTGNKTFKELVLAKYPQASNLF